MPRCPFYKKIHPFVGLLTVETYEEDDDVDAKLILIVVPEDLDFDPRGEGPEQRPDFNFLKKETYYC